jgi:hypothetical protein
MATHGTIYAYFYCMAVYVFLLLAIGCFIPLGDLVFGLARTAMASTQLMHKAAAHKSHSTRTVHRAV